MFWIGFHNADQSNNLLFIEKDVNYELTKIGMGDYKYKISETYLNKQKEDNLVNYYLDGERYIINGMEISMIGAFLFGTFLIIIFNLKR